jgi:CheY-like chemotaxis protein
MTTILYIDDNASARRIVHMMVRQQGYEFTQAENGESGYEMVLTNPPDVILLDVQMPGLAGDDLCRRLKNTPELAHIPVVALTAQAMSGDRERLLAAGFDAYIAKPVTKAVLFETLHEVAPMEN